MSETSTYSSGDTFQTADGTTITLATRNGSNGIRWTWGIPSSGIQGQHYDATPEEAIADAEKVMAAGECRHGEPGFCVDCHDASNR